MSDDLLARWTELWGSGMNRVWQHYTAAQSSILEQGRALVGQTPCSEVYTEGRLRLLHYHPVTETVLPVPVLCIPSLINRYYVMDLAPERSLVLYLLRQGLDVYMLDWGTASAVDCHRPFDEYITGLLRRCVNIVQRRSGQRAVSLLGYCMGGMMAAAYTVLFPKDVRNFVNLAGPINYHDEGIYSAWTRTEWLDVDLLVDTLGNIPAALLNLTFNSVRPTNELVQALNYWERQHDPHFMRAFAAMQLWLNDPTPFPGEAFRKYIKDLYQKNLLLNGEFRVDGRLIVLRAITAPTLTIAARRDHIAPWQSVTVLHDLIGSPDKASIILESGHIGMVIGASAHTELWPRLGAWLAERSTAT
jgi:polyhydroxyalkanoate synthase